MQHKFNDVLRFAWKNYPARTKSAVVATAKRRGMAGLGDDLTYSMLNLDDSSLVTDYSSPTAGVNILPVSKPVFDANGVSTTPAVLTSDSSSVSSTAMDLFKNLTDAIPNLLTAYTANKQLDACAQTNQARLSQGLSPVDCSAFAPQVQVGVNAPMQKTINLALIGVGIFAVGYLVLKKAR